VNTHRITIVAIIALTGVIAQAQEPATQPTAADRITRIENNIKHARDAYQRALADAVAALEDEKEVAIADGDRERTGRIAELVTKLKGPLIASGAFVDRDLDSLFTPSKQPGAPKGLVHLVYDWSNPDQFADWQAESPPAGPVRQNPQLVAGTLVFQGAQGARLRFLKRLAIRSIRLEVEAVDGFQAMSIDLGNGQGFRLHFASGYISDLPGEATKVSVDLQKHVVVADIEISPEGNAALTVGDARVTRDAVAPGALCISIDQAGPVRIKSIVIDAAAP
jgi:hypothetical protein